MEHKPETTGTRVMYSVTLTPLWQRSTSNHVGLMGAFPAALPNRNPATSFPTHEAAAESFHNSKKVARVNIAKPPYFTNSPVNRLNDEISSTICCS